MSLLRLGLHASRWKGKVTHFYTKEIISAQARTDIETSYSEPSMASSIAYGLWRNSCDASTRVMPKDARVGISTNDMLAAPVLAPGVLKQGEQQP